MASALQSCLFFAFSIAVASNDWSVAYAQAHVQTRIVANVDLVQIPVTIFDDKGAVATNLQKSDFRLFDDGIEQRILYFERDHLPV
jgi:hypothetical protein